MCAHNLFGVERIKLAYVVLSTIKKDCVCVCVMFVMFVIEKA